MSKSRKKRSEAHEKKAKIYTPPEETRSKCSEGKHGEGGNAEDQSEARRRSGGQKAVRILHELERICGAAEREV